MSTTIDERVVSMKFDNKNFEKNVQTTMSTLDKLKQKLNLNGMSKGLENVNSAAKKFDINPMSRGLDVIHSKFSALEVMGVTALANITNSAVNAGKRMVSALTIDPVKTGFNEYETKINSIQTIMSNTASKGTTMEDVTRVIDELNTYADKTIYNFTEMTRNIGTFTAAGVGLEESATAIQGIANLAAASGSTSQQASTAMYQLSQALAAGTVKLMDWNSVVNAGMGGELFQNALKDTARAHGVAVDDIIKKNGSFRDSLQEGWISSEILTETLQKMTKGGVAEYLSKLTGVSQDQITATQKLVEENKSGKESYDALAETLAKTGKVTKEQAIEMLKGADNAEDAATKVKTFTQLWDTLKESVQSGWSKTWELMFGDFEEAKDLFTGLSDFLGGFINKMSDARNFLVEGVMDFTTPWTKITEKLENSGLGKIKDVADTVTKAADRLTHFQEVVDKVWKGDFGNSDTGRFDKLTQAGYDSRVVQDLVNKGHNYKLTMEDVEASHKKFGLTMDATTEKTEKATVSLDKLSDEQLKNAGLTDDEIRLYRDLSEEAKRTGKSVNELADEMSKADGRTLLIESLKNAGLGLVSVFKAMKDAWVEIFPPVSVVKVYSMIKALNEFSKGLKMGEETADKLKRTFKGVFAILDIVATLTGGVLRIGFKLFNAILKATGHDILDVTANVGDAIVAFRDWLFEGNALVRNLDKVVDVVIKCAKVVRGWVKEFIELPVVQKNIDRFGKAFRSSLGDVKEYLRGGMDRIREFADRLRAMDSIKLSDLDDIFKDFKDNVLDYFFDIDGCFVSLSNAFSRLREDAKSRLEGVGGTFNKVKDVIVGVIETIVNTIKGIGIGELFTIAIGSGFLIFAKKMGNFLEALEGPLDAITSVIEGVAGITEGFADVLTSTSKAINSFALKMKADAIVRIALSIAILAGAIWVLAQLPTGKLFAVVVALALIGVVLVGVTAAMSLLDKIGSTGKQSFSLLALAASLMILVECMKSMESLDVEKAKTSLGILAVLATGLSIFAMIIGNLAPGLSKNAIFMLAFVFAIKLLVDSMADMDKLKLNNPGKVIAVMIGAIISLSVLSMACKGLDIKSAIGVIAIVLALKILVGTFDDIASLDLSGIKKNLGAFIVIFGMFALVMVASKHAGQHAAKAGLGILAMSVALLVLVGAMKLMAGLDRSEISKATGAIAAIMVVFAIVIAASKLAGENAAKAGVMLLMMSGAMLVLSAVIVILSHIKPDGLDQALDAIKTLTLCFAALIIATKFAGDAKGTLITLTVAIGLLAIALGALSMIRADKLAGATAALSTVIGMFALLLVASKKAGGSIASIIVLTVCVGLLSTMIFMLSSLPVENVLGVAASLSVLLLSLTASMFIMSKAGTVILKALVPLGVMILVVAALATVIGVLAYLDVGSTLEIAASLSVLLLSLSAACLIVSAVGGAGLAAIGGIAILMTFIISLTLLTLYLSTFSDYSEDIKAGIEVLKMLGYGLGDAIGSIIGGFAAGLTSGLPAIGENLSNFATKLEPFFTAVEGIDESAMRGVKALAETLLILTGANILDSLSKWFTDGQTLGDFGEQLVPFGESLRDFGVAVEGVNAESIENAAKAGKALAEFASSIPNTGGLLADIMGDNTADVFGTQLVTFGGSLKDFGLAVEGINVDAISTAAEAGKALAEFANNIPNTGGFLAKIVGDNTADTFGEQLVPFGKSIKEFGDSVVGLNTEAIEAAIPAGKALSDLADNLPNSGGIFGFITGDNTMDQFGKDLEKFGSSLNKYDDSVDGLNIDAILASAGVGTALRTLANSLSGVDTGGLFSEGVMENFGEELVKFGKKMSKYNKEIKGVNVERLTNTTKSVVDLSSILKNASGADKNVEALGTSLNKLAGYLNTYDDKITTIDAYRLMDSTNQLLSIVNAIKSVSNSDAKSLNALGTALNNLGKISVDKFIKSFENAHINVQETGKVLVTRLLDGVKSMLSSVTSIFKKVIDTASSTLRANVSGFYGIGANVAQGFANGISANSYKAAAKARAMANAAKQAAKAALDEHSPSKEFYEIGDFAGLGFVNALSDYVPLAYDSSSEMAASAKKGLRDAISSVVDMLNSDIDYQPTIRPVVDLSGVKSSADLIGGMFGLQPSIGVMTNVGAINSMMNKRQNGDDSGVISAIKDLKKSVGNTGNTYIIDGVTYDDGSNISNAVESIVRAARVERRR